MLVNCSAYQDGRKIADISAEDISEYVRRPDCFVWVALVEPTPEELDKMAEEFNLHPLAVEDAHKGHQRPKIEEYDDYLFVVRNYILSVRHHMHKGLADVRARCEREPELLKTGAGFVLYALMDAIVDRYFPVLEELESALEEIEGRMFRGTSTRERIKEIYALKRRLMVLKHAT